MSSEPLIQRYSDLATVNLISPPPDRHQTSFDLPAAADTDVPKYFHMTFGEFVQFRFVPEYVAKRSSSVQKHFFGILKYVLTPERVADAFGVDRNEPKGSLRTEARRPYMDSIPLGTISPQVIENVMSGYLGLGYAGQTVAHIRNALRTIFNFAATCGCHSGANPATGVPVPQITRKEVHRLAIDDIKKIVPLMRYPERDITLITLITGLQVTEVCGLQWKHVNLSNTARLVDGEWVTPRTVVIRNQSYRGTVGPVSKRRRQTISVGSLLISVLRDLMNRGRHSEPDDFVLCSRNGTQINPDNIALRRLKPIGAALNMPWLSWKVFRNSRSTLSVQVGRLWTEQLAQFLPSKRP